MMLETGNPWQVNVQSLGPVARRLLDTEISGRISAVFERSFYVETAGGQFCVGTEALYDGPLNVVTSAPDATVWRASGLCVDQSVSIGTQSLSIGPDLIISWPDAAEWQPVRPGTVDVDTLAKGVAHFRWAITDKIPVDGLGLLIMPDEAEAVREVVQEAVQRRAQTPVLARARVLVSGLRRALLEALHGGGPFRPSQSDVNALRGLGPGATPSGDDFIGGLLIGLDVVGRRDLTRDLWRFADPDVLTQGNAISDAHLRAAGTGYGAAALHGAAKSLLLGGLAMQDMVLEIDRIGHTSGWDAMAGMIMVFDSVIDASCGPSLNERTS